MHALQGKYTSTVIIALTNRPSPERDDDLGLLIIRDRRSVVSQLGCRLGDTYVIIRETSQQCRGLELGSDAGIEGIPPWAWGTVWKEDTLHLG